MAEQIHFDVCDGDPIDTGMIKILNRLNDLNWRTLHPCESHPHLTVHDKGSSGWGMEDILHGMVNVLE